MTDIASHTRTVNEERQRRWRQVGIYAALTVVTFLLVFPILWMISVSV